MGAATVIVVALGANLPSPAGSPAHTLDAALSVLEQRGLLVSARSSWYETPPDPPPKPDCAQPNYVNGVITVETQYEPAQLLEILLEIEREFGRARTGEKNAARSLDLDLIAYGDLIQDGPPILPHPRMAVRPFVLVPLCDIAADWVHPIERVTASDLAARLGAACGGVKRLNPAVSAG
jgi:2-amino-4-hydroxy-6-hydroxymethyldihydropteridine diphosphokinase